MLSGQTQAQLEERLREHDAPNNNLHPARARSQGLYGPLPACLARGALPSMPSPALPILGGHRLNVEGKSCHSHLLQVADNALLPSSCFCQLFIEAAHCHCLEAFANCMTI